MPPLDKVLISVQEAQITFGKTTLFENLNFNIHSNSKICLIGKNGAGKSTLMNIISNKYELDSGKRIEVPNLTIGYLEQEIQFDNNQKLFDYLFLGLEKEEQIDENSYIIEAMAHNLKIDINNIMGNLSGGQLRRAALAKSLIQDPDLLLLDEPTNHLDFESVKWLENYLNSYNGTFLCISHDRTFLKNISNKVFWLDRGNVRVCPKGYSYFEEWSNMLLEQESRELHNRKSILSLEEEWANRGVKARRKRNVRRIDEMRTEKSKLESDLSSFRKATRKLEIKEIKVSDSSKIIATFIKANKEFQNEQKKEIILNNFNLKIMKGDKIGILGNNGSGKTTFLKMLIGESEPDSGKIKLAKNIDIAYFDQKRSNLKSDESLKKNLCPNGGEYIEVMGKTRHVCGYLKDFMFDPKAASEQVSTLSGGQKNRLMLAKVLANPKNCLILDEPTNDLDMDTLDMLEEILSNYKGTLLVVSHDRDFLDKTINKILAFNGNGDIKYYGGNYSDYEQYIKEKELESNSQSENIKNNINNNKKTKTATKKLTYKLQYELDNIPKEIDKLNQELEQINQKFLDPEFFADNNSESLLMKSKNISQKIEDLENRWLELEEMKEQ